MNIFDVSNDSSFSCFVFLSTYLFSKQKGEEAEKANNLFYHLTYYGPEDLANIEDEEERNEIALHLAHFGHCPSQLFFQPHPSRHIDSVVTQSKVRTFQTLVILQSFPGLNQSHNNFFFF